MGQVPPKYFLPQAPVGSSQAANTLNAVQPQAQNPQTPLLPPNFQDPGKAISGGSGQAPTSPLRTPNRPNPVLGNLFGNSRMFG